MGLIELLTGTEYKNQGTYSSFLILVLFVKKSSLKSLVVLFVEMSF